MKTNVKANYPQFSKGNRKLSKNVLIFNLPRLVTCPGAGACKTWCYEIKIERMYKNTIPFRTRNYKASASPKFVADVVNYLNGRKESFVRIHESGDFYDQTYLDKWKQIAKECNSKIFYCFTKSFHLNLWKNLPSNLQIMQSTGSRFDNLIDWSKATNRALGKNETKKSWEVECPGNDCGGSCTLCIPKSNIHLVGKLH